MKENQRKYLNAVLKYHQNKNEKSLEQNVNDLNNEFKKHGITQKEKTLLTEKLISDGYIKPLTKNEYVLTSTGLFFIQDGGYKKTSIDSVKQNGDTYNFGDNTVFQSDLKDSNLTQSSLNSSNEAKVKVNIDQNTPNNAPESTFSTSWIGKYLWKIIMAIITAIILAVLGLN